MSTSTQNSPTRSIVAIGRGLILVPAGNGNDHQLPASLQVELMNLGFMLDDRAFAAVCSASRDWIVSYHNEIITHLRQRLGTDYPYKPFYANFPAQVMELSDTELFINAILHYWSNGQWEPPQLPRMRAFAFESVDFKMIRLGSEDDLKNIFNRLISINGSLTESDKHFVGWMIGEYGKQLKLPEAIPFKETLCILAAAGLDVPIKTPTDVLRIAVHLSGGDISLPGVPKPNKATTPPRLWPWELQQLQRLQAAQQVARDKFKFKKFSRPQRRLILGLLERSNLDISEMQGRLGRWLRLGEILHVGEHSLQFPRAAEAFAKLRNQRKGAKIRTFAARVDLAMKEDFQRGIDFLATRPGEFARRLDWLLRTFDRIPVLETFARVAPSVSSKVLFELHNHFSQRFKAGSPRAVMIKGARSKMKTIPPLPAMDADLVQRIGNVILAIMRERIGQLPPLGKIWIDERLKRVPVPFAMRSVNAAVKTYVRGTRIPFRKDAKVIRPFIHWYDVQGDQDLDLSVGMYDGQLEKIGHISFTDLKGIGCCHSGDIRHRQGPCAEYVDIPIQSAIDHGVRFATVHVYNYNARPMHTVKDCVFGLMEREHAQANEIFVPKSISNCMALANEGTSVIVCILDLVEGEYIWADVESDRSIATVQNTASRSAEVLAALVHGTKMSVFDLLMLHAGCRGTAVNDSTEAAVIFRWEDLVTDYSKITAFMTF